MERRSVYFCIKCYSINEEDGNYQTTALNRKYSHKYGYGKTDAYKMVHFAETWVNVKPQAWYYSDIIEVNQTITTGPEQRLLPTQLNVILLRKSFIHQLMLVRKI